MTGTMPMIRRRLRAGAVLRMGAMAVALVLALPLAGCSSRPEATFDLSAASAARPLRALGAQVAVSEPVATAPADSDRIVVRPTPDTRATFQGVQWAERLPHLVQTRLLQSFENAALSRFVSRADGRIVAQYSLNTEIRRFDTDLSRSEAVVEISVKLVEEGAGRIAAAKIFSARAPGGAGRVVVARPGGGSASYTNDDVAQLVVAVPRQEVGDPGRHRLGREEGQLAHDSTLGQSVTDAAQPSREKPRHNQSTPAVPVTGTAGVQRLVVGQTARTPVACGPLGLWPTSNSTL